MLAVHIEDGRVEVRRRRKPRRKQGDALSAAGTTVVQPVGNPGRGAVGCWSSLRRRRSCSRQPIERPPSAMRDCQDQDVVGVRLEAHNIRETVQHPSADRFGRGAHPGPYWKRVRVGRNPLKDRSHLGHELTAEAGALLFVP